jgi:2-keto-4-pentenoate hydratase/2-oxohepta-3-ene-1,7-dioic acid hydratase in catechol pathway
MKLASIRLGGTPRIARIDETAGTAQLLVASEALDMLDFIERRAGRASTLLTAETVPLTRVTLLAPIPRPRRNILCIGKNYRDHIREVAAAAKSEGARAAVDAAPEAPIVFTKFPDTVIGPGASIWFPEGVTEQLDYEAELGVIIGRAGRGIAESRALDHVFGYTIINDVSARDWQSRHKQWFLGKSFDTFCPMGPWIATADTLDPRALDVKCWVNDELRQDANTREMIFDIPKIIATISCGITLQPGDVIATGTPAGVGLGFKPPKFLKRGDVVRIQISGIGELVNSVA